jgi:ABC-type multidrug transport system ATPase subunit
MMIEARHLTKRYGQIAAVDGACFAVRPGRVTGFLGPNGADKSTTLEEAFFDLTRDETDYHATQLTGVTTGL